MSLMGTLRTRSFAPVLALIAGMILGESLAWAHTPTIVPGTGLGNTVPFYNSQGISTVSNNLQFNGTAFTAGVWQATAIGAQFGGTGLNTSASSGVPSINAGSWIVNNVLTTNRLLIAATGNTITSNANLTYDGTSFVVGTSGPHAIGAGTIATTQLLLAGTFSGGRRSVDITSTLTPAAGNTAYTLGVEGTLTVAGSGDNVEMAGLLVAPGFTSGVGITSAAFGAVMYNFAAPTGTVNAATLKLVAAPTGATNNYALWVTSGLTKLDGGLIMGAPTGGDKGAGTINVATDIFKNNTAYTNPDYVLEHWATGQITKHAGKEGADLYHGLHSLSDIETYARTTYSLPLMNQNRTGGAFARGDLLMATVEEAYLYLFQHDHRLDTLEARIKALEERK